MSVYAEHAESDGGGAGPEVKPDEEAKIIDVTEENASIRIPNLPDDSNNYVVGMPSGCACQGCGGIRPAHPENGQNMRSEGTSLHLLGEAGVAGPPWTPQTYQQGALHFLKGVRKRHSQLRSPSIEAQALFQSLSLCEHGTLA